jgi:signal transduction histidine kinase
LNARQVAILLATGATVGLVALGIFGAWTWTDLNQRLEDEQLIRTLFRALLVFGIAAVVFGALCVAGFALVLRPVRDDNGQILRIAGLAEDVTGRVPADRALNERMKELHCLYQVLELTTDSGRPMNEICQDIADVLPHSFQYDRDAVACVTVDTASYRSADWVEPNSLIGATIRHDSQSLGQVEIGYRTEKPLVPGGEGPFLREERALLDGVAAHIGRMLHNLRMAESLRQVQRLESVGQLTGGIAHDFNNLLTVIMGNAELLKEHHASEPRAADMADMVVSAAQRGAELTHRLLAFARRQPLDPRTLDVNQLIAGVDSLLRRTLGEHIDIRFTRAGGLWAARADPAQLESALLNLVLNARDAMPRGGHLTVETANIRLNEEYVAGYEGLVAGDYVMLAVSDTGNGMTSGELDQVFEPFYTTKEAGKGTGLGLSMVYGFVKQSRGHISISSEPGLGTTIKMYLPQALGDERAPETETNAAGGGGNETILLVEDDEMVRRYASRQLASLGYRVLTAANGPEALTLLEEHSGIDLLFTDIVMPGGMSGREVAEEVQRRDPTVPVLYTSGYTEDAILHHGRLDRSVLLLSKPYRRAELATMVRKALGVRS